MKKLINLLVGILLLIIIPTANAVIIQTNVKGSDAIWLAGRIDLEIPAEVDLWPNGLVRHDVMTPEEILETLPPGFAVNAGDIISVLNPANGGISFVLGFGGRTFAPDGDVLPGSNIDSFGGISGYLGPKGALVGVFLGNEIPDGEAPEPIDFSSSNQAIDFDMLNPELGQVFFIGDGVNSTTAAQEFIVPAGATRLFLGVPDALGFNGAPGSYDDNDGFYTIRLGINEGLDNDSDGMLDSWELAFGFDPENPADADEDADTDGVNNLDEFRAGTNPNGSAIVDECTLDADGDLQVDALTDGLLFLRHMFEIHGESLTNDSVAAGCTRCSASDVEVFLDQCAATNTSDIDGNGQIDALTDGLLTIRYIFGVRGAALINNSVGDACERCTATEIESYLETMMPAPELVIDSQ
ncbi:MAG: hypothetical protein V3V22_03985 [Methylococcales bacterium]